MTKLSIVVPVYGVELWIERCLRSIVDASCFAGNCELIMVDDGSPDCSIAIAERICAGRPDTRIIRQDNQGLGAARNAGAAFASGEYLWFIDSDDWLAEDGLSRVLHALDQLPSLDVLNLDHVMSNGTHTTVVNRAIPGSIYTGEEYLMLSYVQNPVQYYVWSSGFYRYHRLQFERGIYHEDVLFTPLALYRAQRVSRLAHDCYVYNLREGSIMSSGKFLKHALDMVHIAYRLERFRLDNARSARGSRVLATYSALAVGAVYYYWKRLDIKGKRTVGSHLRLPSLVRPVLRSMRIKYLIPLILMRLSSNVLRFLSTLA